MEVQEQSELMGEKGGEFKIEQQKQVINKPRMGVAWGGFEGGSRRMNWTVKERVHPPTM